MTSHRKIEANRRNARLSTGPSPANGRARARHNALKSGLYSRTLLLPGERAPALSKIRQDVFDQFEPQGAIEEGLAELIIADLWRLDRFMRIENEFLQQTRVSRLKFAQIEVLPTDIDSFLSSFNFEGRKAHIPQCFEIDAAKRSPRHDYAVDRSDRNLLDAYVSPSTKNPMEEVARQRRKTTRDLLRNMAALNSLKTKTGR